MSCYECAGRSLVSACPLCVVEEEQIEMTAHDQGREARLCCHGRDENPFRVSSHPLEHAEWLLG
jgi:hypothetical protein